jgi:hypothetical protein
MASILANELKKGDRVLLRNGWEAVLLDNKKNGNTRLANVFGDFEEAGSVYTSDIVAKLNPDGSSLRVTLTDKQKQTAKMRALAGFYPMRRKER